MKKKLEKDVVTITKDFKFQVIVIAIGADGRLATVNIETEFQNIAEGKKWREEMWQYWHDNFKKFSKIKRLAIALIDKDDHNMSTDNKNYILKELQNILD